MRVIGVAGQMQAGKDSLADHLCYSLNKRSSVVWTRSAFAKAVKRIFMEAFDKDAAYIEKWKVISEPGPDLDMSVRKGLQFIGDGFRKIKSNVWIDLMFKEPDAPRIISDCRYPNELKAIKERGGFTILVVHPNRINYDPNGSEAEMRPYALYALQVAKRINYSYFEPKKYPLPKRNKFIAVLFRLFGDVQEPEQWNNVDYVIINDNSLRDFYDRIDLHLVDVVESFFQGG